ncbi:MFS transporter [Herbaspirillum sp. CF444]|uniref:MFS transporter n=1 Tax=Herbaspirillum sp. CF444 TaxID=1144319 RepID=UPI0002E70E88|nr:MFS transporter [Herbaspirillum sp. CF444]
MSTQCPSQAATAAAAAIPAAAPAAAKPHAHTGLLPLITLAIGFVMAMLDVTVVNVGLSSIEKSLATPLSMLVWIVDGYTLSFAAMLLVGGALADRYGAKNIYLLGLVLFVVASLLCGAAPNGGMLVAARLLQGLGAAFFMPSSLSLLTHVYEDDRVRARMLGVWSATVGGAAAVGPLVGGILIHSFGWRSVFLINVPVGLLGLFMAVKMIPAVEKHMRALTITSHFLGVLMLAALSFVLIQGPVYGWTSMSIVTAVIVVALALGTLVQRERSGSAPLLPRALFATPQFAAANGIGFLINFGVYGQFFFLALFLQQARGADALQTGLQMLPMMAVIFIGNLSSGRMTAHWGPRLPLRLGLTVGAVFSALQMALTPETPYWMVAVAGALANLGISTAIPAMTTAVMQVAGKVNSNSAAAALNANRQIGALVGVALMGAILHTFSGWTTRIVLAYGVIAIVYVLALVLVLRYVNARSAATSAAGASVTK